MKARNVMIVPTGENKEMVVKAKLWLRSRDIEPTDITITIAMGGGSNNAISASMTLWDRILFRLNFWGKLNLDKVMVYG